MKSVLFLISTLLFAGFSVFAATNVNEVRGSHLDNSLACIDCHGTAEPQKRASAKTCIECHGDMKDAAVIEFQDNSSATYKINIHDTHAGTLRCTLCHSSHGESKLYCNTCHHTFQVDIP